MRCATYRYEIRSEEAVFEEIPETKLPDKMIGLVGTIIDKMRASSSRGSSRSGTRARLIRSRQAGLPAPEGEARSAVSQCGERHGRAPLVVQRGVHDAFAEWLAPWPEIADRYRPRFTFGFRSDHSSRAPPALEL